MASYTWNGGAGSYLDPTRWTPAGVPLYGSDTIATISAGTVSLGDAELNGLTLFLGNSSESLSTGASLVLNNAALGPAMTLDVIQYARLEVDGYDTSFSAIAVGKPGSFAQLSITSNGFGQLNQLGTVTIAAGGNFNIGPNTRLNNEGLIELAGGEANTIGTIGGNGTIELAAPNSTMGVAAGVDAGQRFLMQQGTLSIDDYNRFHGTLAGFSSTATALNLRIQFDAATYVQDGGGEHLLLTRNGQTVGELQLADTPDTQYSVIQSDFETTIRPTRVFSDGSIPASITAEDNVTIRNAEPNGQTVALGGPDIGAPSLTPTLVLDNAALGPDFLLTVASPNATGPQIGTMTVQGYDTNYGEIDIIPAADAQTTGRGNTLTIDMQPGAQLNQEGVIKVGSPQSVPALGGSLIFNEALNRSSTLNNDGQVLIGPGSLAKIDLNIVGSGTITVDHGSLSVINVANTQTIDFLGGFITAAPAVLNATIKDWGNDGLFIFPADLSSIQFNQTSAAGGDLQLFNGTAQVGALHLLGSYATADFKLVQAYHEADLSLSGHPRPSA